MARASDVAATLGAVALRNQAHLSGLLVAAETQKANRQRAAPARLGKAIEGVGEGIGKIQKMRDQETEEKEVKSVTDLMTQAQLQDDPLAFYKNAAATLGPSFTSAKGSAALVSGLESLTQGVEGTAKHKADVGAAKARQAASEATTAVRQTELEVVEDAQTFAKQQRDSYTALRTAEVGGQPITTHADFKAAQQAGLFDGLTGAPDVAALDQFEQMLMKKDEVRAKSMAALFKNIPTPSQVKATRAMNEADFVDAYAPMIERGSVMAFAAAAEPYTSSGQDVMTPGTYNRIYDGGPAAISDVMDAIEDTTPEGLSPDVRKQLRKHIRAGFDMKMEQIRNSGMVVAPKAPSKKSGKTYLPTPRQVADKVAEMRGRIEQNRADIEEGTPNIAQKGLDYLLGGLYDPEAPPGELAINSMNDRDLRNAAIRELKEEYDHDLEVFGEQAQQGGVGAPPLPTAEAPRQMTVLTTDAERRGFVAWAGKWRAKGVPMDGFDTRGLFKDKVRPDAEGNWPEEYRLASVDAGQTQLYELAKQGQTVSELVQRILSTE